MGAWVSVMQRRWRRGGLNRCLRTDTISQQIREYGVSLPGGGCHQRSRFGEGLVLTMLRTGQVWGAWDLGGQLCWLARSAESRAGGDTCTGLHRSGGGRRRDGGEADREESKHKRKEEDLNNMLLYGRIPRICPLLHMGQHLAPTRYFFNVLAK